MERNANDRRIDLRRGNEIARTDTEQLLGRAVIVQHRGDGAAILAARGGAQTVSDLGLDHDGDMREGKSRFKQLHQDRCGNIIRKIGADGNGALGKIGREAADNVVYISALTGQGCEQMVAKLESMVLSGKRRVTYFIPNSDGGALNTLYRYATVEDVTYGAEGMTVIALADSRARGMMKKYATDDVVDDETEEY